MIDINEMIKLIAGVDECFRATAKRFGADARTASKMLMESPERQQLLNAAGTVMQSQSTVVMVMPKDGRTVK